MPRIVLRTPFIHHYAGSVFDLERSTVTPNWEFEDRSSPPRTYFLPDNGKGLGVDLPMSDKGICLPSIFVGVDLTTGPCRITSARTIANNETDVKHIVTFIKCFPLVVTWDRATGEYTTMKTIW